MNANFILVVVLNDYSVYTTEVHGVEAMLNQAMGWYKAAEVKSVTILDDKLDEVAKAWIK